MARLPHRRIPYDGLTTAWFATSSLGSPRGHRSKLVVFEGATRTACGVGQTAMGACPLDRPLHRSCLFEQLKRRFHAPGDFALAYVVPAARQLAHAHTRLMNCSRFLSLRVDPTCRNLALAA